MNFNEIRESLLGPDLNKGLQVCVLLVLARVRDAVVARKQRLKIENCTQKHTMFSQTRLRCSAHRVCCVQLSSSSTTTVQQSRRIIGV